MEHLPKKIHQNGISYTLVGDYYIPDLKLPEESRPIEGPDAQDVSARTLWRPVQRPASVGKTLDISC